MQSNKGRASTTTEYALLTGGWLCTMRKTPRLVPMTRLDLAHESPHSTSCLKLEYTHVGSHGEN